MILTVGSYKGGTGKTTTAVMLSFLLARQGPVTLIDADRQWSAVTWKDEAIRNGWEWPEGLTVVPRVEPLTLPPADLGDVVIDTGPGDPVRFREAMRLSDTVLITTGARRADAVQVGGMAAEVEKESRRRPLTWGILLTLVRLRTRAATDVPEAIEAAELPLLHTIVPSLQRYADAYATVPDRFDAYVDVLREIRGEL